MSGEEKKKKSFWKENLGSHNAQHKNYQRLSVLDIENKRRGGWTCSYSSGMPSG